MKPIIEKIFVAIMSMQVGGGLCSLCADILKSPFLCLCAWVLLLPGSLIGGLQVCPLEGRGF